MTKNLDLISTKNLVNLFLNEELQSIKKLRKQKNNITKVISLIIKKLKTNGKIIYAGAGTSGRIGILDATECNPTFSTDSFQYLMAGGKNAFIKAKEGSEDNTKSAVKDIKKLKLTKNDIVIGISASGETPYTISAVKYAKKHRVSTVAITSNPKSTLSKIADYSISPEIKDEIIQGSTRLKSGTAQKIILNMLSSISMIKSGKVFKNLMIDVTPTNKKLIKRAIEIISTVCKVSFKKAKELFFKSGRNTKAAIVMHLKKASKEKAKEILKKTKFNLRKAI